MPHKMHVGVPVVALQEIDLPAEVVAPPAVTVIAEKSPAKYPKVHCSAEGEVIVEVRFKFSVTTPPGLPDPGDKLNAAVCPKLRPGKATPRMASRTNLEHSMDRMVIQKSFPGHSIKSKRLDLVLQYQHHVSFEFAKQSIR
jgi:hypothetical protein